MRDQHNVKYITKNDLCASMIHFRIVIEENNLQEKYKYLNLYCNWLVHPQISPRWCELVARTLIAPLYKINL
jgi:hypothetical protein